MALATRCPHCNALFRVAAEQLRSRGGMVRCGACRGVFNAIAGLDYLAGQRLDANSEGLTLVRSTRSPDPAVRPQPSAVRTEAFAAIAPAAVPPPAPPMAPLKATPTASTPLAAPVPAPVPATESPPRTPAPERDTAAADAAERGPVAARPERRRQPRSDPLAAATQPPAPHVPAPAHAEPAAAGADADADFSGNTLMVFSMEDPVAADAVAADTADTAPDADDRAPSFLRSETRTTSAGMRRALAAGVVLLVPVLLLEAVLIYRTRLQVAWPALQPALEALCAPLSCTASWPMRPDLLAVVSSELQALPGTDAMEFTAVLRSRASFALALPAIELTLTDSLNRPVARKVFLPAEYRADGAAGGGLAAGGDVSVHLLFELPGITAAGFEAYPFYP